MSDNQFDARRNQNAARPGLPQGYPGQYVPPSYRPGANPNQQAPYGAYAPDRMGHQLRGAPEPRGSFTAFTIVLVALGLIIVAFSCLTWVTAEGYVEHYDGSTTDVTIAITGLGSSSVDYVDPGVFIGAVEVTNEREIDNATNPAGIWTLVLGVLLVGAASLMIFPAARSRATPAALLIGLALLIASSAFLADPAGALGTPDEIVDLDPNVGYGVQLVFGASLFSFLVSLGAVFYLSSSRRPPTAPYPGYLPPPRGYPPAAGPGAGGFTPGVFGGGTSPPAAYGRPPAGPENRDGQGGWRSHR